MHAYLCLPQVRRIKKAVVTLFLEMQALDWTSLAAPLDALWVLHRVGDVVYLAKTLPMTSPAKEMVHAIKNAEKSVFVSTAWVGEPEAAQRSVFTMLGCASWRDLMCVLFAQCEISYARLKVPP